MYPHPLDETTRKKFVALASRYDAVVIGFSSSWRPASFRDGARFWLLPRPPLGSLRYLLLLLAGSWLAVRAVRRHGARVLVAQGPYEGLPAAWAKRAARRLGSNVALAVESHGDFEAALFLQRSVLLKRAHRRAMGWAARFALSHADALRSISTATTTQLSRLAPGRPIVRFPTWTALDVFLETGRRENVRREPIVLFVGNFFPLKGVHDLLDAFASLAPRFPEAELVLVGEETNRRYARALRRRIAELGVERKVRLLPPMPQRELATWMHRASVLVLPSLSEGLGRVLLEAMACGTPVVGTDVGGIPDLVRDGVTGRLVPPADPHRLAEAIASILDRPGEAAAMGRRGRAFAESYFDAEGYVDAYGRLFAAALAAIEGHSDAREPVESTGREPGPSSTGGERAQ